jgi:hypothetical protein
LQPKTTPKTGPDPHQKRHFPPLLLLKVKKEREEEKESRRRTREEVRGKKGPEEGRRVRTVGWG